MACAMLCATESSTLTLSRSSDTAIESIGAESMAPPDDEEEEEEERFE